MVDKQLTRTVKIGAATAFFNDSRMGIAQLLEKAEALDYIIFDFLAESVMGGLGRGMAAGTGTGFATDFADVYILPHLHTLLDRRIRIVANAGACWHIQRASQLANGVVAHSLNQHVAHAAAGASDGNFQKFRRLGHGMSALSVINEPLRAAGKKQGQ